MSEPLIDVIMRAVTRNWEPQGKIPTANYNRIYSDIYRILYGSTGHFNTESPEAIQAVYDRAYPNVMTGPRDYYTGVLDNPVTSAYEARVAIAQRLLDETERARREESRLI